MTYPDWLLKPCGTPAAYRRHRRRGENACPACRDAEARRGRRSRSSRWTAVHADRGNGRPRCGHERPHSIGTPGQEVTCKRCILLAEMVVPYTCRTCAGVPPKGYACLECGTEARAA